MASSVEGVASPVGPLGRPGGASFAIASSAMPSFTLLPLFTLIARVAGRGLAGLGLLAAGWLLAVLFGLLGAAPASADTSVYGETEGGTETSYALGVMADLN
ncbi:hypothetical protein C1I98_38435, partial [Spongiactinospora gelatinilytica]